MSLQGVAGRGRHLVVRIRDSAEDGAWRLEERDMEHSGVRQMIEKRTNTGKDEDGALR